MKNLILTSVAILGLASIGMSQNLPSYVPTTGLVGWWPFNGNAYDESGNGNNGNPMNEVSLCEDRYGILNSAYFFDGFNDYIQIPGSPSFYNDTLSISFWANWIFDNYHDVIQYAIADNGRWSFKINSEYAGIDINIGCGGPGGHISQNGMMNSNLWNHLVFILEGTQTKLFINGDYITSFNHEEVSCFNFNYKLYFGLDIFGDSEYFKGKLDDIGIWVRSLTLNEIAELYESCSLISVQPTNQTVNISENAAFFVGTQFPSATYQWQTNLGSEFINLFDTSQISGATNDTLSIINTTITNNNQRFRCILTLDSCDDTTDVALLTVNDFTVVSIVGPQYSSLVHPNPAHDYIQLKLVDGMRIQELEIISIQGKTVKTTRIINNLDRIDISNLPAGVYLLRMHTHQGLVCEKLLKL
jgi:hypothetical protein